MSITDGFDWVGDVAELHELFDVDKTGNRLNARVMAMPVELRREFLQFRVAFLREELEELERATKAEDVVDAMIDLCVVAIGTLDAFGVDARKAWSVVHAANVVKRPGENPRRPNPFGLPDLLKPDGWTAPSHADNVGLVEGLM